MSSFVGKGSDPQTASGASSYVVKVRFVSSNGETELRKMRWPPQRKQNSACDVTSSLSKRIRQLFSENVPSEIKMRYIDDDGDWVTLDKHEELDTALLAQKIRPLIIIFGEKSAVFNYSTRHADDDKAVKSTTKAASFQKRSNIRVEVSDSDEY